MSINIRKVCVQPDGQNIEDFIADGDSLAGREMNCCKSYNV